MQHPNHVSTLTSMIKLRRLPAFQQGTTVPTTYRNAWGANGDAAELRILEIAELAYILEADGFPEPEIFRRIGYVHTPSPDFARLGRSGNPLRGYVVEHLSAHAPSYLKLGTQLLNTALAFAELWAMHAAQRRRDAQWPPEGLLHPPGPLAYLLRDADEDNEFDHLPPCTGAIETLDTLIRRSPFPVCPDFRRMRARAVPGDELRSYSTGTQSFQFMMGSAGIALVRSGRAIDFIELLKN